MYRRIVARLNYLAPDRIDIQFAVKECARYMSAPRGNHWAALVRIGRYLKGRPRLVMKFGFQDESSIVTTFTDSDWAGCRRTAKSTSGGIVTMGGHVINNYARQQKTIAPSSAEAELHAVVAASAETLGIVNLCRDMGFTVEGEIYVDSSAALGITQRAGLGKVRHLRVQALWVQDVRANQRLTYKKVLGTRNPSDVLTKHVPGDLLTTHLKALGLEVRGGRAESAPTLDSMEACNVEWTYEGSEEGQLRERHERDETKSGGMKPEGQGKCRVRFNEVVEVWCIGAVGRQRKIEKKEQKKEEMIWKGFGHRPESRF